jgi:hypothetical protein
MPAATPLDILPNWVLFLAILLVILLASGFGHRMGIRRNRRSEREKEGVVGGMVAAELGLLGFLLAFTFGFAASRFDTRRQILLDESNAIGTTFLRGAMLPQPQRDDVRQMLREYVDVRLEAARTGVLTEALRKSDELHRRLWDAAVAASEKDPRSVPTGLFVESLNEVIDIHAKRLNAIIRSRIPMSVWAVLFAVAFTSFAAMGYHAGLTAATRSPASWVVAVTFAVVIWLVVDLDRPGQGLLRVSQQPMVELRESMGSPPPAG